MGGTNLLLLKVPEGVVHEVLPALLEPVPRPGQLVASDPHVLLLQLDPPLGVDLLVLDLALERLYEQGPGETNRPIFTEQSPFSFDPANPSYRSSRCLDLSAAGVAT